MKHYYVNGNANPRGAHTVHVYDCRYLPSPDNRIYVGFLPSLDDALQAATKHFRKVTWCAYCAPNR